MKMAYLLGTGTIREYQGSAPGLYPNTRTDDGSGNGGDGGVTASQGGLADRVDALPVVNLASGVQTALHFINPSALAPYEPATAPSWIQWTNTGDLSARIVQSGLYHLRMPSRIKWLTSAVSCRVQIRVRRPSDGVCYDNAVAHDLTALGVAGEWIGQVESTVRLSAAMVPAEVVCTATFTGVGGFFDAQLVDIAPNATPASRLWITRLGDANV